MSGGSWRLPRDRELLRRRDASDSGRANKERRGCYTARDWNYMPIQIPLNSIWPRGSLSGDTLPDLFSQRMLRGEDTVVEHTLCAVLDRDTPHALASVADRGELAKGNLLVEGHPEQYASAAAHARRTIADWPGSGEETTSSTSHRRERTRTSSPCSGRREGSGTGAPVIQRSLRRTCVR
jgi:hypothetical protein